MTNAIWIILHDLQHDREGEYLDWFHGVHIPEKLARPGYTWAAHYQVTHGNQDSAGAEKNRSYIAFFGADSTNVFYNPSPAQIKPTQSIETQDMMGCRRNSRSLILSGEWAADADGNIGGVNPVIDAAGISVALCDAGKNDEDFSSWLVQEHLKSAMPGAGGKGVKKYLASTGDAKHAIIQEYNIPPQPMEFAQSSTTEWGAKVRAYISHPLGQPQSAIRIWPASSE